MHTAKSLLLIVFFVGACSHARTVEIKPGSGGVIAVSDGWEGHGSGKQKAKSLMKKNCRRGYRITKEGEAVVGSRSRKRGARSFTDVLIGTNDEVESRDSTEWRIYYRCR